MCQAGPVTDHCYISLSEDDVLNGDIFGLINPYPTANFWWWPGQKKFHYVRPSVPSINIDRLIEPFLS